MIQLRKCTPTLRFPEFNHEWHVESLERIFALASGTTPSRAKIQYFQNGTHNWVKTTDLNNAEIAETEERVTNLALEETSLKKYPRGTVLIALYGGFNQIGRTGLLKVDAAINQALVALPPNSDRVEPYFLLSFLNRNVLSWRRVAASSRKDPNLTQNDVAKFHFVFPEIEEQRKIGAFLSTVDEKIGQLSKKKELLLKYKKGVMQQIFDRKICFKDDNGNNFPDWQEKEIIEIAPLQRGFDLPIDRIVEGEFPVVFSNGILRTHNEAKAKGPGVVTGRSGTIGKVMYVEKDYWPHNTTLWVTDFKSNHPKFIFYFYLNFRLDRFGTGSGVPTLNRNDIHHQKVLIPNLPEQIKIADFISALDEKINLVRQQLDKTKFFKKGLLQQLFV